TDGNTGTSPEQSFTTLPAPSVSEVVVSGVSVSSSRISFSVKGASKAKLSYGASEAFGAEQTIDTSEALSDYSFNLSDLNDDTKYYFRIDVIDAEGNVYLKDVQAFTTIARPKITNLRYQPIADAPSSTQEVTWSTNVPTTSRVSYGPVGGTPANVVDSRLKTEHKLLIEGLIDDTDYVLQAISVDEVGNSAESMVVSFKTEQDTRPPKISNIEIETTVKGLGPEARGQLVVSWTTDELATSQVTYGAGQNGVLSSRTPENTGLTTEHVLVLQDIKLASIYSLQIITSDKSGNQTNSDRRTAVVGRASDNVYTIIVNALDAIFGGRRQ
ncbi:fibronectin type III domain-containing protein, partial [Candidatus Saccharibacteria bacterium]|nr:fibronectin type III domain-containing protein [Candidatus Saccharibacteria bacterium]